MASPTLLLLAGRIVFLCFGTSRFVCIVWCNLRIFYVFLLPPVFLISLLKFYFSFLLTYFYIFLWSFLVLLLVVVVFLSVILVWVPTRVLTICLWSSVGGFFHRQILLLHIFNRWTPWCLSGYLSVSCSLSRFRTRLSSSLGLSDSKSPPDSRALFIIPSNLNNVAVSILSISS